MLQQNRNYYTLTNPPRTLKSTLLDFLKIPFSLPSWILSFLLSRNITHVTLNPDNVKTQKPVHFIHTTDEKTDKGNVIINLLPKENYKSLKDYLLKLSNTFFGSSLIIKRHLNYDNPEDKAHVDKMIEEIYALLEGRSTAEKCTGIQFKIEELHFKGLEGLDRKLHAYFHERLYEKYRKSQVDKPKPMKLNFFSLETPDGAVLDSVSVSGPKELLKPISQRKFVVACMARDQNYINWIKDFNYSAKQIGCTVVGFNYRGIDYSKGMVWTQENLINDTLAQVQRLIDLGAKPENIGLEGMSLGAAVATLSAARLHEQGIKVKLYNERSFRSLPRLVSGYIMPKPNSNPWNPINWLRYAAAGLVYIIVTPLMWLLGWHMDAASAWEKIPQEDKNYTVARDYTPSDTEKHQDDGIIHDSWASLASLVDEEREKLNKKLDNEETLTVNEQQLLLDNKQDHEFKVCEETNEYPNRLPHHIPRRHLVNSHDKTETLHQFMTKGFSKQFAQTQLNSLPEDLSEAVTPSNNKSKQVRRPLLLASSGGGGHISSMMGIIDSLKADKNVKIQLTEHRAHLHRNKPFSWLRVGLNIQIFLSSIPLIGPLLGSVVKLFGYPHFPTWKDFHDEIDRLEQSELDPNAQIPMGKKRPYVDMLLDFFPIGYESAALWNILLRTDKSSDLNMLVKNKEQSDKLFYQAVYDASLKMLIDAADKGLAYTEIISTQPLALNALCDAVLFYNQHYVPNKNLELKDPIPQIEILQYLTDLPSLDCNHFLDAISNLTPEQQQLMHVHAVNFTPGVVKSYFDDGMHFKGIHTISPKSNPMIRAGFKDKKLVQYTDPSKEVVLKIKDYHNNGHDNWVLQAEKKEILIPANAKVASILLGSLASDATVSYVKHLLESEIHYDKIFIFGGLNKSICKPIEDIINAYPENQRAAISERIVRIGFQSDEEIAPIMTRSDCVVTRGGGLSVMEQMALPLNPNKKFLFHHQDINNQKLTSGLAWEDGNVDKLIDYLTGKKVFAQKTSPNLARRTLNESNASKDNDAFKDLLAKETYPKIKKKGCVYTKTDMGRALPFFNAKILKNTNIPLSVVEQNSFRL